MSDAYWDARVRAMTDADLAALAGDHAGPDAFDLLYYRPNAVVRRLADENRKLRAEVERLKALVTGLAERVLAQSELLTRKATKTQGVGSE